MVHLEPQQTSGSSIRTSPYIKENNKLLPKFISDLASMLTLTLTPMLSSPKSISIAYLITDNHCDKSAQTTFVRHVITRVYSRLLYIPWLDTPSFFNPFATHRQFQCARHVAMVNMLPLDSHQEYSTGRGLSFSTTGPNPLAARCSRPRSSSSHRTGNFSQPLYEEVTK